MAQVLAPIAQTSGSITMLHSSSDAFQNTQPQSHQQQRSTQMPRTQVYNTQSGGTGYRGTSTPIAPYAFNATPQLRAENRSTSAPNPHAIPQLAQPVPPAPPARTGPSGPSHTSSASDSTASTSGSSSRSMPGPSFVSKDDSELRTSGTDPTSAFTISTTIPDLSLSVSGFQPTTKTSPGRYRRGAGRSESSNSGTASSTTITPTQQSPSIGATPASVTPHPNSIPALNTSELSLPVRPGHYRASSDDLQLPKGSSTDKAKQRYRRRSLSGLDANALAANAVPLASASSNTSTSNGKRPNQDMRPQSSSSRQGSRPASSQSHERQGSAGSASSNASNRPTSKQENGSSRTPTVTAVVAPAKALDTSRRMAPSPLSQPMSPSEPPTQAKKPVEANSAMQSPAMKQLTALNDKEKGMKSRLRRAFSFGSAAELRKASAENNISAERAKLRKDRYQNEEEDPEQAAIIAKQEAAGIGAGIYSGQGGFTGSTDNLSISSTASSASVMLRKMGSGMKKGTRSIKGLFRPKSVIGVPAADGPITQPSVGQVSMVTVEAERQKVNVNVDPHSQNGGGTGYPRLERNSIDTSRSSEFVGEQPSRSTSDSLSRKSIVGGDRERAEVLSSIKKGILKRTGTNSDASSPIGQPMNVQNETPKSSAPSTPNHDGIHIHANGNDYFARTPHLPNQSTRSLPSTPQILKKNLNFSPRIQFHDAWSASDYDRRGEIATCNRLTPMLAQQIKEELNSFKMEMEVHELSKPHTHFF